MPVQNAIAPEVALAAVTAMNARIDDVMTKLDQVPQDQRAVRLIPGVTVGKGPDGFTVGTIDPAAADPALAQAESEVAASPPPAAGPPPPDVTFVGVRAGERTDAEVFARITAFLDPTQNGPLFVSRPIRRRIYFGKYPSFAEMLSAGKVLGSSPNTNDEDVEALWRIAGELGVAIMGWLVERDPGIEQICAHAGDVTKWPPLRRFSIANNRDPLLTRDIVELYKQYLVWKVDVTPTEDEMEKYWAQNS